MTEVWTLGVEELVTAIGAGQLGAVEVVEAFAVRAGEVDAILNCFIALDADAAQRTAARERAGPRGPLHGVPYGYKDVFVHGGVTPTVGARGVTLQPAIGTPDVLAHGAGVSPGVAWLEPGETREWDISWRSPSE